MEAREMSRKSKGPSGERKQRMQEHLIRKWAFMHEGMTFPGTSVPIDRRLRYVVSQICENQVSEFMEAKNRGILSEDTRAANVPDYVRFIFPVIRRVWANLIAPGLVSIQPMTAPVGGIFYWEYKYGTTKGTVTAGQNMIANFDRFYSSEFVDKEQVGATANGSATSFSDTLSFLPVKRKTSAQVGIALTYTIGGLVYNSIPVDDSDGTLSGQGIDATASTIDYTTGAITVVFSTAPDSGTKVLAHYYFNMEGKSENVPQVNVDIQLQEIKATSRKIRFNWSSESADDMRSMLGMDVESELVSGVASEMSLEIDREIIQDCRTSGTTILDSFDATVPPAIPAVEHYRNILTPLTRAAMTIAARTKRGPGNWIVLGTRVAAILSQLETHGFFKSVFSPGAVPSGMGVLGRPGFPLPSGPSGYGVTQLGVLQNRWQVFLDPYFDEFTDAEGLPPEMLVGLKGTTFVDAGYTYAPYVPMQVTPTFLEPADWTLRKGMRTRYAKKLTNPDFYARVTTTGL